MTRSMVALAIVNHTPDAILFIGSYDRVNDGPYQRLL